MMRVFLIFDLLSAVTWSNSIHTWRKIPPLLNIKNILFLLRSCANKPSGSGQEEPTLTLIIKLEINN